MCEVRFGIVGLRTLGVRNRFRHCGQRHDKQMALVNCNANISQALTQRASCPKVLRKANFQVN